MKLKTLLEDLEILEIKGNLDIEKEIQKIEYNSKNVSENDIFVAIKGYKTDGHIYIESAKKQACYACIVEDFVDVDVAQI